MCTQHLQPLCDTNVKQPSEPRVIKGFPIYERSHKTTLRADKTTAHTQHLLPLCGSNGTQPSGPSVNKGFPYMEDHTEPLCRQTKPIHTPNTHNHCMTLMENNHHGPVLIRVSLIWKITLNHFVGRQNHYVHTTATTTV